jgi:hypothetical protein
LEVSDLAAQKVFGEIRYVSVFAQQNAAYEDDARARPKDSLSTNDRREMLMIGYCGGERRQTSMTRYHVETRPDALMPSAVAFHPRAPTRKEGKNSIPTVCC